MRNIPLQFKMADEHCVLVKKCNSNLSCCGVVIDGSNGIVLTVASLFADLLPELERQPPLCSEYPLFHHEDFASMTPNARMGVEVVIRLNRQGAFTTLRGSVVLFWRDSGLQRIARRIFPSSDWKFETPSDTGHLQLDSKSDIARTISTETFLHEEARVHENSLSCFALVYVKGIEKHFSEKMLNLSSYIWDKSEKTVAKKGDEVLIVGTPFGCECPSVFYNSVSKGIVSNIIGANDEVIITDARCVPGCEGCAMYVKSLDSRFAKHTMVPWGIILAPFCWKNGEWIGITIACSIEYILKNLMKLLLEKRVGIPPKISALVGALEKHNSQQLSAFEEHQTEKRIHGIDLLIMHHTPCTASYEQILKTALASVVIVQSGKTWGSGIILDADKGFVVTCSHVIPGQEEIIDDKSIEYGKKSAKEHKVLCLLPNGICRSAEVLYATSKDFPLDLALLRIQPHSSLRSLKPRQGSTFTNTKCANTSFPSYYKGEEIFVTGFPLFESLQHDQPSISSGVISNIVYDNKQAVLLQSTAAVQCGASGGALVSMATGELLGMVTSHAKDVNLMATFPHVNFSIPADFLCKLVSLVKDGLIDHGFCTMATDRFKSIWRLKSPDSDIPQISSKL